MVDRERVGSRASFQRAETVMTIDTPESEGGTWRPPSATLFTQIIDVYDPRRCTNCLSALVTQVTSRHLTTLITGYES